MSTEHTDGHESTDVEPRTRRALERVLTVTCDVHSHFASNAPGPVVATSDGGLIGGETDTDDDSTDSAGSDGGLEPSVREHVERHGSGAHGHDFAPDRSEPADFGGGDSTGVQEL